MQMYLSHLGEKTEMALSLLVLVFNKARIQQKKRTYNHHGRGVVMGVESTE